MSTNSMPAELAATIAAHRLQYRGWRMMADEATNADPAAPEVDGQQDKPGDDDGAPLGPKGEKALERERDARKALEKQFNELRAALSGALGEKADPKAGVEEQIVELTKELGALQRQTVVDGLARKHGITDEADLGLLVKAAPEDVEALAQRLAPRKDDDKGQKKPDRRFPSADPSQGGKESGKARADLKGVDLLARAFEDADNN